MQKTGSIVRSPTVLKNIETLSELSHLGDHGKAWTWLDLKPILLAPLVIAMLFVWALQNFTSTTSHIWLFPENPIARICLELAATLLIFSLCALLLRKLGCFRLDFVLRLPVPCQFSCSLLLSLSHLRQSLQWGVRHLQNGSPKLKLVSEKSTLQTDWGSENSMYEHRRESVFDSPSRRKSATPKSLSHSDSLVSISLSEDCLPKVPTLGVQVYSNGDIYEGEFFDDKFLGKGVYYFGKRGRYEGEWVDGKYEGLGIEMWRRGNRYRGQYKRGFREGYGQYRFYTGDVFSGQWSHGQAHGIGMQKNVDGNQYLGEFAWGAKHGVGKYSFSNGDVYYGEYFGDRVHGYGVYEFANGHRYEGAWHEGRKQGLGLYTFKGGETRGGYWNNGMLQLGSTDCNGSRSPSAISHACVLLVAQEAQRAAEKARILKLDEGFLEMAITGAKSAAAAARALAVKASTSQLFCKEGVD